MEPWGSQSQDAIFCLKCGYSLRGQQEERCPECGTPYDSDDPRTYLTSDQLRSRRYRPILRVGVAVVVLVGLGVVAINIRNHWVRISVTEGCVNCGALRSFDVIQVYNKRLWHTGATVADTEASKFILATSSEVTHEWTFCSDVRSDWWGNPVYPRQSGNRAVQDLTDSAITVDALRQVATRIPNLRERLQADILRCKSPSVASVRADCLVSMCRRPTAINILQKKHRWDLLRVFEKERAESVPGSGP